MLSFFSTKNNPFQWPVTTEMHCHVLPGIDDGAADLGDAISLLKGFVQLGYTKVIATPHVISDLYPNTTSSILQAHRLLSQKLAEEGLPLTVHAAAEYLLDDIFMDNLKRGDPLLPLKENFILTEFSLNTPPRNPKEASFALITGGYQPILGHPERYQYFHNNTDVYFHLKELGFLLQLNILSLTGQYGAATAKISKWLLKNELIDFLGTDLHHADHLAELQSKSNQKIFREHLQGYAFRNDELKD